MSTVTSTLDARRAKAAEAFRAQGVPHRRVEAWKYTDLHNAVGANDVEHAGPAKWSVDASKGIELFDLADGEAPNWVRQRLGSLVSTEAMDEASLGFARSGFAIRVGKSSEARVKWSGAGQARVLIVLEDGASLSIVEEVDTSAGFRNIGMEIVAAKGAQIAHTCIAPEAHASVQVSEVAIRLAQNAVYRAHFANFGAKLSRTELHIALEGEGAKAHLSGVGVLRDGHADVTTHITHAVGNTQSTQLFKYVAGGHSRGVYQGKVTVEQGANGSDSRQTAKGLLLEDRAEIDLKPELEILADDVKCAHGAAVGDLDAQALPPPFWG